MFNRHLIKLSSIFYFSLTIQLVFAQTISSTRLKNAQGRIVELNQIISDQKPSLFIYWRMDDKKSCENLKETFHLVNDSIGLEKINVIAVCGRTPGSSEMAEPWLKSQELNIDFYYDINDAFRRQLGFNQTTAMVINSDQKVALKCIGYLAGNENIIYLTITRLLNEPFN